MENQEASDSIHDKILKIVARNYNISYAELVINVGHETNLDFAIYELIYAKLLISNSTVLIQDNFSVTDTISQLVTHGVKYVELPEILDKIRKRSSKILLLSMAVIVCPLLILAMFFGFTNDTIVAAMIISLSLTILMSSYRSKFNIPLASFSLLLLLHLLIFPIIYTVIIRNNPKSFSIDGDVISDATNSAKADALKKYDYQNVLSGVKYLDIMLKSKLPILESKTDKIENYNIVRVDSFLLIKTYVPVIPEHITGNEGAYLNIFNLQGNMLSKTRNMDPASTKLDKNARSLRELIANHKNSLSINITAYKDNNQRILQNRFWTYLDILPHSLNIFSIGNIVPKNTLSNYIYLLHQIIFVLLVGLVAFTDGVKTFLQRLVETRNQ